MHCFESASILLGKTFEPCLDKALTIEAQSSNGTVYLQVVVYDEEARNDCRVIHEGDTVKVTGVLSVKPYQKKDGTVGTAVTIERPTLFVKIASNNCHPQLLQQTEETINNESSDDKNAVTASDEAYYSSYKDYSDIENPWEYEPEELEKIFKHIEEYKKRTRTSSPAGTVLQEQHAETASQQPNDSDYEDVSDKPQYPFDTPEDDLPF